MPIDLSKVFGPESRAYQIGDLVKLRRGFASHLGKPYLKDLVGIVSCVGGRDIGGDLKVWFPESPLDHHGINTNSIEDLSHLMERRFLEDAK
jgi:hypothetical protein